MNLFNKVFLIIIKNNESLIQFYVTIHSVISFVVYGKNSDTLWNYKKYCNNQRKRDVNSNTERDISFRGLKVRTPVALHPSRQRGNELI